MNFLKFENLKNENEKWLLLDPRLEGEGGGAYRLVKYFEFFEIWKMKMRMTPSWSPLREEREGHILTCINLLIFFNLKFWKMKMINGTGRSFLFLVLIFLIKGVLKSLYFKGFLIILNVLKSKTWSFFSISGGRDKSVRTLQFSTLGWAPGWECVSVRPYGIYLKIDSLVFRNFFF